jgi:flagellar hook-associated protein 3 FlgL
LADALERFDEPQIHRLMSRLDQDFARVNFARGELGARGQFLDLLQGQLDNEVVQLQAALSDEIDTDLVSTISELTNRQTALQAALQLMGKVLRLSLLDFL